MRSCAQIAAIVQALTVLKYEFHEIPANLHLSISEPAISGYVAVRSLYNRSYFAVLALISNESLHICFFYA